MKIYNTAIRALIRETKGVVGTLKGGTYAGFREMGPCQQGFLEILEGY